MKLSTAVFASACAALESVTSSALDEATCSSLNGPSCAGFGPGFAVPPLHARQNVVLDEEKLKVTDMVKNLKIEKVLKQYAMEAVARDADDLEERKLILDLIAMLKDDSMELPDRDDSSLMADAVTLSSTSDAFELLGRMNGDELKDFFETALDKVLLSVDVALLEISSDVMEAVRTTARQLKALKNYSTYTFQRLTKSQLASIKYKFTSHRLSELQQAFEQLVVAGNTRDRQLALETAIFLFQLAQEEGAGSKESEVEETEAATIRDAVDDAIK